MDNPVENVENLPKEPPVVHRTPLVSPGPSAEERQERLTIPRPPVEPAVPPAELEAPPPAIPAAAPLPLVPEETPEEEVPWRLVGELFQTYVVVEQGEQVHLIDKHAAHERMQFDRMKAADYQPMSQTLLTPVVFTPAPEEGEVLLEQLPLLARFGFVCEEFGGGALVIRAMPADLDPGQGEAALSEIAGQLLSQGRADPAAARDALLHTMACKAAVKGGQKNSPQELLVVARAVLSGQVKYCPHGRPVAITLSRGELERQFKRS